MDEVGNIFVLAMLVCLLIALVADVVVLSVSPIETNWKKGEVVERYEKGRVNKYIIAKAVRNAFLWAAVVQALTLIFIFINL